MTEDVNPIAHPVETNTEIHAVTTTLKNGRGVRVEFMREPFQEWYAPRLSRAWRYLTGLVQHTLRKCNGFQLKLDFLLGNISVNFDVPPPFLGLAYGSYHCDQDAAGNPVHRISIDPSLHAAENSAAPERLQELCALTLAHEWGHLERRITGKRAWRGWDVINNYYNDWSIAFFLLAAVLAGASGIMTLLSNPFSQLVMNLSIDSLFVTTLWGFLTLVGKMSQNEEARVERYAKRAMSAPDKEKLLACFRVTLLDDTPAADA